MLLIGKPRMCLAVPSCRKEDSLAQVDVEERQHMRYMNVGSVLVTKPRKWW